MHSASFRTKRSSQSQRRFRCCEGRDPIFLQDSSTSNRKRRLHNNLHNSGGRRKLQERGQNYSNKILERFFFFTKKFFFLSSFFPSSKSNGGRRVSSFDFTQSNSHFSCVSFFCSFFYLIFFFSILFLANNKKQTANNSLKSHWLVTVVLENPVSWSDSRFENEEKIEKKKI